MTEEPTPLYRRVLGRDYDRLPVEIQAMHEVTGPTVAHGVAEVTAGPHPMARLVRLMLGMPGSARDIPLTVTFRPRGGGEIWIRDFDGHRFRSTQKPDPSAPGALIERFGPLSSRLMLQVEDNRLRLHLQRTALLGLPLPRFLWPRIDASETVAEGLFTFDVSIGLPVIGPLIRYRGTLTPR